MKRSKAGPESMKTENSRRAGRSPVEKLMPPRGPLIAIVFTLANNAKESRLHIAKEAIATGMKLEEIKECQEVFKGGDWNEWQRKEVISCRIFAFRN